MNTTQVSSRLADELKERLKDKPFEPITLLKIAQEIYGYVAKEAIEVIAELYKVPPSYLYGVASFYPATFSLTPPAKITVRVCTGTQCTLNGGRQIIEAIKEKYSIELGETTADRNLALLPLKCLKTCCKPPVVVVNDHVILGATPELVLKKIEELDV